MKQLLILLCLVSVPAYGETPLNEQYRIARKGGIPRMPRSELLDLQDAIYRNHIRDQRFLSPMRLMSPSLMARWRLGVVRREMLLHPPPLEDRSPRLAEAQSVFDEKRRLRRYTQAPRNSPSRSALRVRGVRTE